MEPIKRIDDLTFEEILAIPIDSVMYNNIIDLECAHKGISLLPEYPGLQPDLDGSKPDAMLHRIGNWGFKSITDAQDVIEFMVNKGIYAVAHADSAQIIKPMTPESYNWPEIKSTPAFTPEAFDLVKENVIRATAIMADWKEKNSAYESVYKERKAVITEFETKRRHALEVTSGIIKIKDNLKRYLVLAQGSYPIAVTFLKEADKHGVVIVEDNDAILFMDNEGVAHPVTTREQYQKRSMNNLLDVKE